MRSDDLKRSAALFTALAFAACGGGGDAGSAEGGEMGEEGEGAVDPATVGTISGTVNFTGDAPAASPIDMSAEPACAEGYTGEGPMTQAVVVSGGGLENVFVYLSEGVSGAPAPSGAVVLDQENCRYAPHVLGVQTNQTLEITNSDDLLHNINANPTENRGFNISQPRAGITSTQQFALPEVMIPVRCDVHGWMSAYIGVTGHPYHGVSGSGGSFTIADVPAGEYTLTAWHEEYGTQTASVTVTAQGTAEVSFDYDASMTGAHVPLGEPLVIHHEDDGSIRVERGTRGDGAGQ